MNCVRCKSPLTRKSYEGVEIDRCENCNGVWLDQGELEQIIAREEATFSPGTIRDALTHGFTGVPEAEEQSVELCPKCDARMIAVNYSYSTGIVIDRCPNQHGLWLDGNEMEKIQANQEHWRHEISNQHATFVHKMKNVEAMNHVSVEAMKGRADHVPSSFFLNRVVATVMKIFGSN